MLPNLGMADGTVYSRYSDHVHSGHLDKLSWSKIHYVYYMQVGYSGQSDKVARKGYHKVTTMFNVFCIHWHSLTLSILYGRICAFQSILTSGVTSNYTLRMHQYTGIDKNGVLKQKEPHPAIHPFTHIKYLSSSYPCA